jgi:hypothetical protein
VFYYTLKTPGVLAKVMQELDTAKREGAISPHITLAEGLKLPYLYVKPVPFLPGDICMTLTDLCKGKL